MLGFHIRLGLEVSAKLAVQAGVVRQPNQYATLLCTGEKNTPPVITELGEAVAQRAHKCNFEAAFEAMTDGLVITEAAEIEVAAGQAVRVLAHVGENILEEKPAELTLFGARWHRGVLDLAANVPLFVGEKEVEIPIASDERFGLLPAK